LPSQQQSSSSDSTENGGTLRTGVGAVPVESEAGAHCVAEVR
jgi:hypothetical protein